MKASDAVGMSKEICLCLVHLTFLNKSPVGTKEHLARKLGTLLVSFVQFCASNLNGLPEKLDNSAVKAKLNVSTVLILA